MIRHETGFTLIEMILVVAVIGLLTAMATFSVNPPSMNALIQNEKLKLQEVLIRTRNMAVLRNECAKADISGNTISSNAYPVAVDGTCTTNPTAAATATIPGFVFDSRVVVSNFDPGGTRLIFNPQGSVALKEQIKITLTTNDPSGTSVRAIIYPAIGQIRVR